MVRGPKRGWCPQAPSRRTSPREGDVRPRRSKETRSVNRASEVPVNPKYEIRVRGRLSRSLASEFERLDLSVSELPVETVLNGSFEDQAALYGILRQIEGLGLELIDVHRLPVRNDGVSGRERSG